jgi:hypothetical protein
MLARRIRIVHHAEAPVTPLARHPSRTEVEEYQQLAAAKNHVMTPGSAKRNLEHEMLQQQRRETKNEAARESTRLKRSRVHGGARLAQQPSRGCAWHAVCEPSCVSACHAP